MYKQGECCANTPEIPSTTVKVQVLLEKLHGIQGMVNNIEVSLYGSPAKESVQCGLGSCGIDGSIGIALAKADAIYQTLTNIVNRLE